MRQNLSVLRSAVELYYYEHAEYPGENGDGTNAAASEAALVAQLTLFTDADGAVNATKTATYRYGPYLRTGLPPCPVAPRVGKAGVEMVITPPAYTAAAADAGWVFNYQTGDICVNSDATDVDGVSYDTY